jgi:hypothetical protein
MPRRRIDQAEAKRLVVAGRRAGLSLAAASAAAGVHVATTCRWQASDPAFACSLENALWAYWLGDAPPEPEEPPPARWRNECPLCRAKLVVRTTRGGARFWRCGLWPRCRWASWRPRHPRNCPRCRGPRLWSHSHRSVVCEACGMRTTPP